MSSPHLLPRTLAARFLWIVFLGAVLPLALVGLWLTRSAERAGTALLQAQLETEADALVAQIERKWALREGELQLLANNSVARSVLSRVVLSSADSMFLVQLAQGLVSTISSIEYVDSSGVPGWSFESDASPRPGLTSAVQPSIEVNRPVIADGLAIGRVRARVRLASILSPDVSRPAAPGAVTTASDANGLLWSSASSPLMSPVPEFPAGWEVVRRTPAAAPLQIAIAAPSAPFVKPFESAARTGLTVLMAVALAAFAIVAVLTSRATRSLARLSEAASAVALGDLDRQVPASGGDEIGELASSFNKMTDSLRRTLAELSQQRALAAVGEFAASLAHEVRNALTAVRVDLQHAKRHLPSDNAGTALLMRALASAQRLDVTVTSALRAARSGQVPPSRIELRAVLEQAMEGAIPSFAERSATLEPLSMRDNAVVVGDASALEHMFLNLLINAGQAVGTGGHARVHVDRENGHVIVRIADSGPGIPMHQLAAVGEMFRTTKPDGTGLGVPIARRIAAAHGGDLTMTSDVHEGTTAIVRLPMAPA